MNEETLSYKAEFEAFWEQLTALPAEISDAYDVCSVLSEANGKTTFLVSAKQDGMRFIVKTADKQSKENLAEEYALLKILSGNGFPRALVYSQDDSHQYLVREYVEGDTLDAYVDLYGVFSESETVRIAYELCHIIKRLHSLDQPVIHRDIKPQNIIYTPQHSCTLIDLGAARRYDKRLEKDTVCIGTAIAAAPEQFGYRQTDIRSDIYALGVLMLFLCTGSYDLARIDEIRNKRLLRIIQRCTRFDPDDRYPSIRSVQNHLWWILPEQRMRSRSFFGGLVAGFVLCAIVCFSVIRLVFPRLQTIEVNQDLAGVLETKTSDTQPVVFSSGLVERAVRETLGMDPTTPIYESALDQITQLLILGDSVYTDWDSFLNNAKYYQPQKNGSLYSLEDISKFKHLNTLGIVDQNLVDLSVLAQTTVERLVLGNNLIVDITALSEMSCLRELYLNNNPLADVSILKASQTLTKLDISSTNVTNITPLKGSRLQSLSLLDTPIADYSPLIEMPQIEELKLDRLDENDVSICAQLTQLVSLTLNKTPDLMDLAPLSGLTKLSFLDLINDGIRDISGVAQLSNLDYICLIGNPISDLSPLANAPRLSAVNITNMDLQNYRFVLQIPSLKTIYCDAGQKDTILQLPGADQFMFVVS